MSDDVVERLKIMARWINCDGRYPTPTPVFAAQCAVDALEEIERLQATLAAADESIMDMGTELDMYRAEDGITGGWSDPTDAWQGHGHICTRPLSDDIAGGGWRQVEVMVRARPGSEDG